MELTSRLILFPFSYFNVLRLARRWMIKLKPSWCVWRFSRVLIDGLLVAKWKGWMGILKMLSKMFKTSYRWKHYFSTCFGYTETPSNSRDVSKSTWFSVTPYLLREFLPIPGNLIADLTCLPKCRCDSVLRMGHRQMGQDNRRSKQHDHVLHKNRILCTVFPKLVNEVPRRLVKSSKISKFSTWAERKRMALLMG